MRLPHALLVLVQRGIIFTRLVDARKAMPRVFGPLVHAATPIAGLPCMNVLGCGLQTIMQLFVQMLSDPFRRPCGVATSIVVLGERCSGRRPGFRQHRHEGRAHWHHRSFA